MSNRIFQAVWECGPQSRSEMLVLMVLADGANAETAYTYPSLQFIAEGARMSVRSVRYALRALESDGWIISDPRTRENGSQASSGYTIQIDKLGLKPLEEVRADAKRKRAIRNISPPARTAGTPGRNCRGRAAKTAGTPPAKTAPLEQTNKNKIPAEPIFSLKRGQLSDYDLTCLREGKDLFVAGMNVKPHTREYEFLRALVSSDSAQ